MTGLLECYYQINLRGIVVFLLLCGLMTNLTNAQAKAINRGTGGYKSIANYTALLNTAKSPEEKAEREHSYLTMVGVAIDLGKYRTSFIQEGKLINLFPSAYYHTTYEELKLLAQGVYTYPVEKMRQMLAFYDAYKFNRSNWDNDNHDAVEPHWKAHFEFATFENSEENIFCARIGYVLATAVIAHVQCDLPRAIRYSFDNAFDPTIGRTNTALGKDFSYTENLFSLSMSKLITDVSKVRSCPEWFMKTSASLALLISGINYSLQFAPSSWQIANKKILTACDVVRMRNIAWQQAKAGTVFHGIDGAEMKPQPSLEDDAALNHDALFLAGSKLFLKKDNNSESDASALFTFRTVQVPGEITEPVETRISVEEDEYVYIECKGTIGISSWLEDITGAGTRNFFVQKNNKYSEFPHGCLVAIVEDDRHNAESNIFPSGVTTYGYMSGVLSPVTGMYFLSKASGELLLDINDNDPGNNSDAFTVNIFTMKKNMHYHRNIFNKCPALESSITAASWEAESRALSLVYHGKENISYRGSVASSAGCQCVYNSETHKIVEGEYKGSFDIAHWLKKKRPADFPSFSLNYLHLILDMLPHDLYTKQYPGEFYQEK